MSDSKEKEYVFNEELMAQIKIENGRLVIPPDAIEAHLGTLGTTVKEVRKHQQILSKAIGDITGAAGKLAVDYMNENGEVPNVPGEFKLGHASTTFNVLREDELRISPTDISKGTRKVYGNMKINTTNGMTAGPRTGARHGVQKYAETTLKK